MAMASRAEETFSRLLRAVLAELHEGAVIPYSNQFCETLRELEYFLYEIHIDIEWRRNDSFDGIIPLLTRKLMAGDAEIFGLCIFMIDQTVTPLHFRVQITPYEDSISWFECRLGEKGDKRMVRIPYESLTVMSKRIYLLDGNPDRMEWVYKKTFGTRRSELLGFGNIASA